MIDPNTTPARSSGASGATGSGMGLGRPAAGARPATTQPGTYSRWDETMGMPGVSAARVASLTRRPTAGEARR